MSLQTRITALATSVANDIKALFSKQGNLASLQTTEKSNLVGAINEVVTASSNPVTTQNVNQTIEGIKSFSNKLRITPATNSVGTAGTTGCFEVGSGLAGAAAISFWKENYAINMGLDSDNVFRLGGWSQGSNTYRFQSNAAGNFVALGNVSGVSDKRLKTDIVPLENTLSIVMKITGYRYFRIDTKEYQIGFLAQDIKKQVPEVVGKQGKYYHVSYGNMVPLLNNALKEHVLITQENFIKQNQEIADLRKLCLSLQKRLDKIEAMK